MTFLNQACALSWCMEACGIWVNVVIICCFSLQRKKMLRSHLEGFWSILEQCRLHWSGASHEPDFWLLRLLVPRNPGPMGMVRTSKLHEIANSYFSAKTLLVPYQLLQDFVRTFCTMFLSCHGSSRGIRIEDSVGIGRCYHQTCHFGKFGGGKLTISTWIFHDLPSFGRFFGWISTVFSHI